MKRLLPLLLLLVLGSRPAVASQPASPTGLAPRPGLLLVASETMADPRFQESVILITRHDTHGVSGLILNHPLGKLPPDLEQTLSTLPDGVFWGGPVEPLRVYGLLFGSRAASGEPLGEGLRLVTDTQLETMLHQHRLPDGELRVYLGYSGWTAPQLAHEIARGDWHVVSREATLLRRIPAAQLWPRLVPTRPSPWI